MLCYTYTAYLIHSYFQHLYIETLAVHQPNQQCVLCIKTWNNTNAKQNNVLRPKNIQ
jgi:hypothetical protein